MVSSTSKAILFTMARPCRLRAPSHTRISTVKQQAQQARFQQLLPGISANRHFSQTVSFSLPRKDSQHKDSINTEATEYSKSASDDEGARQGDAAFDPDITDPQEQKDKAGEGTGEGTVSKPSPQVRWDRLEAVLHPLTFHTLGMFSNTDAFIARIRTTLLMLAPRIQK